MSSSGVNYQPFIESLGGPGIETLGGQLWTLSASDAIRNVLDDGSGDASVAGSLTVAGALTPNGGLALNSFLSATHGLALGAIVNLSATASLTTSDFGCHANAASAAISITLNHTNGSGVIQYVKKTDATANTVTIIPDTGTLDGAASVVLTAQYESAICIFKSPNWFVIASNAGAIL